MGDYSCTFSIDNRLDASLTLVKKTSPIGYWIGGNRNPPQSIAPNTATSDMQLKDYKIPWGTDGTVIYKTELDGKPVIINIYIACPTAKDNIVVIKSDFPGLKFTTLGFVKKRKPNCFSFIIERAVDSVDFHITWPISLPSTEQPALSPSDHTSLKRSILLESIDPFDYGRENDIALEKVADSNPTGGDPLQYKCSFSFVIGDHPPNPQSTGNNESDEKPNLLSSFEVRVEEETNIPNLWTGTGAKIAAGPRLAVDLPKESAMLAFLKPGDRIFIVINVEVSESSSSLATEWTGDLPIPTLNLPGMRRLAPAVPVDEIRTVAVDEAKDELFTGRRVKLVKALCFGLAGKVAYKIILWFKHIFGEVVREEVKHWAVVVGDNYYELDIAQWGAIIHNSGTFDKSKWGIYREVGFTSMTDDELLELGKNTISGMRKRYNIIDNNCQIFVYGMLKSMGIIGKRTVKYTQDPAAKPLPKKLLYYRPVPPDWVRLTEEVGDEIVPKRVGDELVPMRVGDELVPNVFVPSSARVGDGVVPLYEKVDNGFVPFAQAGKSWDDVGSRAFEAATSIVVRNASESDVEVFVSKYSGGGSDEWYTVKAGASDSWSRDNPGWELVAFGNPKESERAGVYVTVGSLVTFHSISDIRVD